MELLKDLLKLKKIERQTIKKSVQQQIKTYIQSIYRYMQNHTTKQLKDKLAWIKKSDKIRPFYPKQVVALFRK